MRGPDTPLSSGLYDPKALAPVPVSALSGIVLRSTLDSSDYRLAAAHMHSFTHGDFNIGRHHHIRPRSELYHAKLFPAFYSLAAPLPTNNSTGQYSGDLNALDCQLGALDCQAVLLIKQARFGFRGHHELTFFVADIDDLALNRRAINVHVQRG